MLTFPNPVQNRVNARNKVIVAQLGARQDYTIPIALQNLGCLTHLYTDTYFCNREARILKYLNRVQPFKQLTQKCLSRTSAALNRDRVTRFNWLGFRYVRALQKTASILDQYQTYIDYGQAFNHAILQRGLPEATHLYAFDHAALELFSVGRSQGISCILDQIYPGPYHEKLADEEFERSPDWIIQPQLPFSQSPIFQQWTEIQQAEWSLADRIIVASEYTRRAITHINPSIQPKIQVVPLTVNLNAYLPYQRVRHQPANRPLRVLFVGRASVLKGIHYLLQAVASLSPDVAQLSVIGTIQIHPQKVAALQNQVNFRGAVPHVQMPQIYQAADLLVFPTVSDGFGAVMLEAMATGLPVIATDQCGDIVIDGCNGYRIPIRQPDAIAEKILHLQQTPDLLTYLSQGAIATSQQFSLAHYQSRLAHALGLRS